MRLALLVPVVIAVSCSPPKAKQADVATPTDSAAASLYRYFRWTHDGQFDSAGATYSGEWKSRAQAWFPHGDTLSAAGFLREGCKAGLFLCRLTPHQVVEVRHSRGDTSVVVVEFADSTGAKFKQAPCCGSTGDSSSAFSFRVVRVGTRFAVLDNPVYQP